MKFIFFMSLKHLFSTRQIEKPVLIDLTKKVEQYAHLQEQGGLPQSMEARRVALLFYGQSTRRTFDSFYLAVQELGWTSWGGMNADSFSGMVEGNSFEHAIQFYGRRSHALVLRHPDALAQESASKYSSVPILSAGGSKAGEHPTQALGDYVWLRHLLNGCEGKEVAFVGNLRDSSSVHSLCYLLRHDEPKAVYVVSPEGKGLQDEYAGVLKRVVQVDSIAALPQTTNAIYLVQSPEAKGAERFYLTKEKLDCFSNVRVLHPLPEGPELPKELFADSRVVTDAQMDYVYFARAACLEHLLLRK